jgi:hypothetical protein
MLLSVLSVWYCQTSFMSLYQAVFSELGQLRIQIALLVAERIYLALT